MQRTRAGVPDITPVANPRLVRKGVTARSTALYERLVIHSEAIAPQLLCMGPCHIVNYFGIADNIVGDYGTEEKSSIRVLSPRAGGS